MRFRFILTVTGWGSVGGCPCCKRYTPSVLYTESAHVPEYCGSDSHLSDLSVREPVGMNLVLVFFRKWPRGELLDSFSRSFYDYPEECRSIQPGWDRQEKRISSNGPGIIGHLVVTYRTLQYLHTSIVSVCASYFCRKASRHTTLF